LTTAYAAWVIRHLTKCDYRSFVWGGGSVVVCLHFKERGSSKMIREVRT